VNQPDVLGALESDPSPANFKKLGIREQDVQLLKEAKGS
jgi:hypothetical protein